MKKICLLFVWLLAFTGAVYVQGELDVTDV